MTIGSNHIARLDGSAAGRLSTNEIQEYHERGFLGPFRAFDEEAMAGHRSTIVDTVLVSPSAYGVYPTQSRHLDSWTLWTLCNSPAIVGRLQSLFGPDLMVWYSNIFDRHGDQPQFAGEYPWHQDVWHWLPSMRTLAVWLAITPATRENGCVEIAPGTHLRDIPYRIDRESGYAPWFGDYVAEPGSFNEAEKVEMIMDAGEFFIFNERTLHHSNPNLSDGRRIGFSFRVAVPSMKSPLEYPAVMLSGEDRFQTNQLVSPPQGEPAPRRPIDSLPDARTYTFDQAMFGDGWHLVERDGDTWYRWTGPQASSWIDLRWPSLASGVLDCRILHAASQEVLQGLQIRVNGSPIELTWSPDEPGTRVRGPVAATTLCSDGGRVRIQLDTPLTIRPSEANPTHADTRSIGLAIRGLTISESS
jgi:hypothetical protein